MIVTVSGRSGLTNAYRSVLSARGSWPISGASEWLDAAAGGGAGPRTTAATANVPAAVQSMAARVLRPAWGLIAGSSPRSPVVRRNDGRRFQRREFVPPT